MVAIDPWTGTWDDRPDWSDEPRLSTVLVIAVGLWAIPLAVVIWTVRKVRT